MGLNLEPLEQTVLRDLIPSAISKWFHWGSEACAQLLFAVVGGIALQVGESGREVMGPGVGGFEAQAGPQCVARTLLPFSPWISGRARKVLQGGEPKSPRTSLCHGPP